ncbi:rod shape-determining protein [Phytoactinopolyspora limicola]|uniref:rod shape-determining protein n=1 Tax=Phytoactinopolyspora limicola TaxID=2715536 RepID=UPI00140B92D6|nr:rod shape-determining protein [Phytoactinopolyspora limicola]
MGGFGIDLGTANTVVGHPRRGIVFDEPSVMVAHSDDPTTPVLVGRDARALTGRTPAGYQMVRPLQDGVVVDLESARAFIVAMLRKIRRRGWPGERRRAVIGVPAGATTLECRALLETAHEAGLRKVALLPEPIAGAFGSGIDPLESRAHMVVDIGGGTSEITGFCYGGVLASRTCRVAGDELTRTLTQYLRAEHRLMVGDLTAETIKSTVDDVTDPPLIVEGRDAATGRARLMTLETDEVKDALRGTVDEIVHTLTGCLEDLPAQATSDIMSNGVLAIGGGALMSGFTRLLEETFGFPVKLAGRPLTCVAEGTTRALNHPPVLAAYGG